MKLAEALILRADLQKRLAQVAARLTQNVLVQEGDAPAEDPAALLAEHAELSRQLALLIPAIHHTNLDTHLADGRTLTQALTERDLLDGQLNLLRRVVDEASVQRQRHSMSEVRWVPVINAREWQAQADALAKQRRELDTALQQANWLTELQEA
ncbi:DIP1984 family protein [Deinococcus sp. Marseille-Q6407]|uniref:DIP1984 family protein n=1 Tax=Deinococcus sp. Marseille-Q6407 TaxID=2969223 RepID=UPI0021BE47EF|nr:DIP1984 family protein [Deinococcus sp. Marseille-Q6407]